MPLSEIGDQNEFNSGDRDELSTQAHVSAGTGDRFGRELYQSQFSGGVIDSREAEKLGLRQDDQGFFGSFGDSVNRTSKEMVKGVAKTFGADRLAYSIETDLEHRKDLDPVKWSDSKLGWIGDSLGMGLTESAGMVAVSALATTAGAPVGVAGALAYGTSYVRMYGENRDAIESMNEVGLDEGEITGVATLLTAFQAGVEIGFGVETRLGMAIGGRGAERVALKNMLKTKSGKDIARRMGKEFFKPTNPISGAVSGGAKEYLEEVTQEMAAIQAEAHASGVYASKDEIIQRAIIEPLRALPAGMLMGGAGAFGHTEQQSDNDSDIKVRDEQSPVEVHGETDAEGRLVMTEQGVVDYQIEVDSFSALKKDIQKVKGVSTASAEAITNFLWDMSYAMSNLTKKHARTAEEVMKPVEFIEGLKTVAMKDNLTSEDLNVLSTIQADEGLNPAERSKKMMDYIGARYGSKSKMYGAMRSIKQTSQMFELRRLEEQLTKKAEVAGAAPFISDDAVKVFSQNIRKTVNSILDDNPDLTAAVSDGQGARIDISSIQEGQMNDIEIAQLYMYGADVKVKGNEYRAEIIDGKLSLTPVAVIKERLKASREVQTAVLERTMNEQATDKTVIADLTASDTALINARADYAILANKVLGMEDFIEYFKNRFEWTAPETADVDAQAERVFRSGKETLTGQEIINFAKADAVNEEFGVEEQAVREKQVRRMGDEAMDLYASAYVGEATAAQEEVVAETEAKAEQQKQAVKTVRERISKFIGERAYLRFLGKFEQGKAGEKIDRVKDLRPSERADARQAPYDLFQEDGELGGLYQQSGQVAMFFANSDAGSIIHEVSHHMFHVLPAEAKNDIQQSMKNMEGVQAEAQEGRYGVATEEAFANSINAYVLDGTLNPALSDDAKKGFADVAESIGYFTQNQLKGFELDPDVDLLLQSLFTETSELEVHGVMAEAASVGMEMDPPSLNQTADAAALKESGVLAQTDNQFSRSTEMAVQAEVLRELSEGDSEIVNELIKGFGQDMRQIVTEFETAEGRIPTASDVIWVLGEQNHIDPHDVRKLLEAKHGKDTVAEMEANIIERKDIEDDDVKKSIDARVESVDFGVMNDVLFQRRRETGKAKRTEAERKSSLIQHLHGRMAKASDGQNVHAELKEFVREIFPEDFDGKTNDDFSMTELSVAQLEQVKIELMPKKARPIDEGVRQRRDALLSDEGDKPTADHPDKVYDKKAKKYAAKIMLNINKALDLNNMYFTNLSFFTKFLNGFKYDGGWTRHIMTPIASARQLRSRIMEDLKLNLVKVKEKHGLGFGTLSQKKSIQLGDRMFTESEIVLLSMAAKKIGGKPSMAQQAIMESNDITQAMIDQAVTIVNGDRKLTGYAGYLTESYQNIYDIVAPVYKKVSGKTLPQIENYFPMVRKNTMWSENDPIGPLLEVVSPRGQEIQKSKLARTKSRVQIGGSEIRLTDAEDMMISYADSAANYAAKAELIKNITQTVNTPDIKNHINRVYGASRGGKIFRMLENLLAKEMFANAKMTGMDDGQLIAKDARDRFTLAMLGGRLMTMPKQTVSYFNFMGLLSGAFSPRFIMRSTSNMFGVAKSIVRNSSENSRRAATGEWETKGYLHLLDGHRLHDLLKEKAPLLYDRHGNPETADLERHGYKGFLGLKVRGVPMGDVAMIGLKVFDITTVGTAWLTGYEYIKAKELAKNPANEVEADRIAASTISAMISDSQPPSVGHERTPAQTDNEWLRGLFPFSGQTMINWQNWINTTLAPSVKLLSRKDFKGLFRTEGHYASVAQRLGLGFVVPAIALGALSRRRWPKDREEAVLDVLLYPVSQIPAFGSQFAYGLGSGYSDVSAEPVYLSVGNGIMKSVIDIANGISGRGEFGEKETNDFLEAAGILMSVPTSYTKFLHVMYREYSDDRLASFDEESFREATGTTIKE